MAGFDGIRPIQPPVEPLQRTQPRERVERRSHAHDHQQPQQQADDEAQDDEQPTSAYDDHGRRTSSAQRPPEDPTDPPRHVNFRA